MSEASGATLTGRIAKCLRFSLAAWVSIVVGISLLLLAIATWAVFNAEPQRVAWGDYVQWPQLLMLAVLWSIICLTTYWTVRIWSEDIPAREQDLEAAWQAGMEASRKRGVPLRDVPLYLVLGCTDEKSQLQFVRQAGLKLIMEAVPAAASAPLRWCFAEDRVLLFCSDAGVFAPSQGRLALHRPQEVASLETMLAADLEVCRQHVEKAHAKSMRVPELSTNPPTFCKPSKVFAMSATQDMTSTIVCDSHPAVERVHAVGTSTFDTLDATEQLIESYDNDVDGDRTEGIASRRMRNREKEISLVSSRETIHYQSRLEDLCRRLQFARLGLAPINGIIAWVDGPQLMDCVRFSKQCGRSLRRDLLQIQEQLGLLSPITIAIDRMHELPGFTELIRHMGPERVSQTAMGEAFRIDRLPDAVGIDELSDRSIRAIQSAVYQGFWASDGSIRPANHKLFQLILACRGRLVESLQGFLIDSILYDPSSDGTRDPEIVDGVYFTASGEKPTQQGFSSPVFARMIEQQELLAWTSRRHRQEQRHRLVALILKSACGILLVAFIIQAIACALSGIGH